ncbi:MAG: DNA adenine methylase [Acidobacteriota bacterium]
MDPCAVNFEEAKAERVSFAPVSPFVKWAGGKRRLLDQYASYLPSPNQFNRYFEPFLGGGAVFFYLRPQRAVLADLNAELINCYKIVKEFPEELIANLRKHKVNEEYFYRLRETDPATLSELARASRFIYLNKTCYNGLYRVNSQGQFNVPYGRYKRPLICDPIGIHAASTALQAAQLKVSSFEKTVRQARRGDFVYFDPPYVPLTPTASFTSYTPDSFSNRDQERLAELVHQLNARGCLVMVSNSNTTLVRELYRNYSIKVAQCPRSINSNIFARGAITELVIKNY